MYLSTLHSNYGIKIDRLMTALIIVICIEFHIHSASFQSWCTSNRVAEAVKILV